MKRWKNTRSARIAILIHRALAGIMQTPAAASGYAARRATLAAARSVTRISAGVHGESVAKTRKGRYRDAGSIPATSTILPLMEMYNKTPQHYSAVILAIKV